MLTISDLPRKRFEAIADGLHGQAKAGEFALEVMPGVPFPSANVESWPPQPRKLSAEVHFSIGELSEAKEVAQEALKYYQQAVDRGMGLWTGTCLPGICLV